MLLPNNRYAYLRTWADRKAGKIIKQAGLRTNQRYKGTLTDEEEALAMRLILEHG
jgi:DNA replication initiation complex subunit (GINS family)